jgi:ubiquinone/menaquinone biosynthesis C-methylase UbiE
MADSKIWDQEYEYFHAIPSSTRTSPSKTFLTFSEILGYDRMSPVLDLGCGPGRNAVYLARKGCMVHAVDSSEVALRRARIAADEAGVSESIRFYNHSLDSPFPFDDAMFQFVVDSYVFCHFIEGRQKQFYRDEIYRVLKPGGVVYCSLFLTSDEYYACMIGADGVDAVVTDPANGITKQLYRAQTAKDFFRAKFAVQYDMEVGFDDVVLSKSYRRRVLVLILRREV